MKQAIHHDNNNARKLFFTSDQLAFFDEDAAKRHARRLTDKTVTSKSGIEIEQSLDALMKEDWSEEDFYGNEAA